MAAPVSTNAFLDLACKSGLVSKRQLDAFFAGGHTLPEDAQKCAVVLVQAKLLTWYQAQRLLAGKTNGFFVGPYKILGPIAKGGMGIVYLAVHPSLRRKVALKVLPAFKADDQLAHKRFLREARTTSALDHPNIVRLFDMGDDKGVAYLVLEYVEGRTLLELLQRSGPLHYSRAAEYIAQAAAGLQHAHAKGIIHRDIKPSNLMLASDDTIKVLDLGLARSYHTDDDDLTGHLGNTEDALGSIDYASPEQALCQPLDARSDVYSLGATLYTLLAGQPPFQGSLAQKLMQHQLNEPPQLAKLRAKLPPAFGDVLAKMIAKRPEDRYQSAQEVMDALTPWLSLPCESHRATPASISCSLTQRIPVVVVKSEDYDVQSLVETVECPPLANQTVESKHKLTITNRVREWSKLVVAFLNKE